MTREVIKGHGAQGLSGYEGSALTALVVSGNGDAWLLPDDPFLNAGCKVVRARSMEETQSLCDAHHPRLVFLPLGVDGEPALPQVKRCLTKSPAPVVVVVAANDQINAAAEAMRAGAYDCLFKPFSPARLSKTIQGALKSVPRAPVPTPAVEARELHRTPAPGSRGAVPPVSHSPAGGNVAVLGASPQMRDVLKMIEAVAQTPAPVFLSGTVGTGKSLLARLIHDRSERASRPFVTLDCATVTAEAHSEIFGPDGVLAGANGGTVFLDEICELNPDVQALLLRRIETNTLERGPTPGSAGPNAAPADLRFVTATRHDPQAAMQSGRLRADLYYRLHVAPIEVPPLRARDGDIALIARTKLGEYARRENRDISGFSDAALDLMTTYDWPGNVRELLNVVWTAVLLHRGPLVTPDQLPAALRAPPPRLETAPPGPTDPVATTPIPAAPAPGIPTATSLVGKSLAEIERAVIEATILAEGGSIPRAARVLDVSPSTIYRKREAWMRGEAG